MENHHSPTERPNEPGTETDEQTDGCWLTGGKGPCRAVWEIQGPRGLGKRSRGKWDREPSEQDERDWDANMKEVIEG